MPEMKVKLHLTVPTRRERLKRNLNAWFKLGPHVSRNFKQSHGQIDPRHSEPHPAPTPAHDPSSALPSAIRPHISDLTIVRWCRTAVRDLSRNVLLSLATIIVLTLMLSSLLLLLGLRTVSLQALNIVNKKVDLVIEVQDGATLSELQRIMNEIRLFPSVEAVTYISKEEALAQLKTSRTDLPDFLSTYQLDNPLPSYLQIVTSDPRVQDRIRSFLAMDDNRAWVNLDALNQHSEVQARTTRWIQISDTLMRSGFTIMVLFGLIAVLILMTTMKIVIHNRATELQIMKIVGATNTYIRSPLILEGLGVAILATAVATGLFHVLVQRVGPDLSSFLSNQPQLLSEIWITHLPTLILLQLVLGGGVSLVATLVSLRQYLKRRVAF